MKFWISIIAIALAMFIAVPALLITAWKISGILMGIVAVTLLILVIKFRNSLKPKARWQ